MKRAKRFYKSVSVVQTDAGHAVHLDGRALKTPGKVPVLLSQAHAEIVAAEWDAQIDDIRPELMPCTRLVNVALERTPQNRSAIIKEARNYAQTDLLCYRATDPKALVARQDALWNPVLAWAAGQGIALQTTDSLVAITQNPEALEAVAHYVQGLDDLMLTLCVHLIAVYGSAVLGIAVIEGYLTANEALSLSRLDEIWQIERWGEDEEAAIRTQLMTEEVSALSQFLVR